MENKILSAILLSIFILTINCQAQTAPDRRRPNGAPNAGLLDPIGQMNDRRAAHTAVLLKSGKVLIAGGFSGDEFSQSSAELFDSKTNAFSPAGPMNVARASHTATLLPDGRVLIAGGFNGEYLDSAEIYDPETGKFTAAGKMTMPRSEHVAVSLKNGTVLLAGGVGTGWTFLADAEIYDPATNLFTKTGRMAAPRESHTATQLTDGRVLITGGHRGRRAAIEIYRSAEIYDPSTGRFSAAADLTVKRHKHDAVMLDDGRVLIVGGADERDGRGAYTNVEIYEPKTNVFSQIGNLRLARYKLQGTSLLLKNGKVLIAGGSNRAEIFDPASNGFELAEGKFETARLFSTATLLPNGRALIVGGYDNANAVSSNAWLYRA